MFLAVAALLITGCGGGSGGSSASGGAEGTLSVAPASTALSDNPVTAGATFNNFQSVVVALDVSAYSFAAPRVYLKLFRPDGEILYLGEVDPHRVFTQTFDLPLATGRLHYELFTGHPSDATINGEIML